MDGQVLVTCVDRVRRRPVIGALTMIFIVAYQAYLPTLVRREDLVRANSVLTASSASFEVAAFGSAGWLVQVFTAPMAPAEATA